VRRFEVTITYVDPSYAEKQRIPKMDYVGTFLVLARDPEDALVEGERQFRDASARLGAPSGRLIRAMSCRKLE
jgi:hypothetical protein